MARRSETGNVTKICGCAKWKECAHPWYVAYSEGKDDTGRYRRLRGRLADLVGREPGKFPPIYGEGHPVFRLDWNITEAIEAVWVSPYAREWYRNVVEAVLRQFAPPLLQRLKWSQMKGVPLY
jgi:hypothetical protein